MVQCIHCHCDVQCAVLSASPGIAAGFTHHHGRGGAHSGAASGGLSVVPRGKQGDEGE